MLNLPLPLRNFGGISQDSNRSENRQCLLLKKNTNNQIKLLDSTKRLNNITKPAESHPNSVI